MPSWKKIWSREYSVQYSEIAILSSLKPSAPILGGYLEKVAMVPEGPGVQSCFADDPRGWDGLMESVAATHLKNAKSFSKFKADFKRLGEAYLASAEKISKLSKYSSLDDLAAPYSAFFSDWLDYTASLWASFLLNERATSAAESLLAEKLGAKKGADFSKRLLQPSKPTEINLAIRRLSELRAEKNHTSAAEEFVITYPWFSCLDLQNPPWTVEDAKRSIESAAPAPKTEPVNVPALLNGLDLTEKERFFLESAHELCFIKDQRDVYRRKGVFLSQPFYSAVGKPAGQAFSDVAYWTCQELSTFLQGGGEVPLSEVKKRKNGFLLYGDASFMVCVSGTAVASRLEKLGIVFEKSVSHGVIKGLVGNVGKASGPARIVRTVSDLQRVQKGDVMVSVTTHPDFVPAMHRACAVVTDEGGLTCHAAIVSREFGIPCVVGTKNATRAFQDGDNLEVDADSGEVRKKG